MLFKSWNFMNSIVAHKNIEEKNPENPYFQFFVMTSL